MAEDLDVVGLGFDTSGYDRGIDHAEQRLKELQAKVEASGEAITAAQTKMGQGAEAASSAAMPWPGMLTKADIATAKAQWNEIYGDPKEAAASAAESAKAALASARATYEADSAAVKLAQMQGMLNPKQAAEAGRLNAMAYNEAVMSAMTAGGVTYAAMPEEFSAMAGSLMSVEKAATHGSHGIGRLNQTLVGAIDRTRILSPAVGHLGYTLGSMAIGSAQMIPIMAGLAAASILFEKLANNTSDAAVEARKAEQAYEDAYRAAEDAGKSLTGEGVAAHMGFIDRLENGTLKLKEWAQFAVPAALGALSHAWSLNAMGLGAGEGVVGSLIGTTATEKKHLDEVISGLEKGITDMDDVVAQGGDKMVATWEQTWKKMTATSLVGWKAMIGYVPSASGPGAGPSEYEKWFMGQMDAAHISHVTGKVTDLVEAWAAAPRTLKSNYDALDAINKVLSENGVTIDQLPPKLQDYIHAMQGAGAVTKQQSEKMIAEYEQLQRTSDRLAGDLVNEFDNVITGTENVAQAFRNMVDDILKEMARLAVQKEITKPLAAWLTGILSGASGAIGGGGGSSGSGGGGGSTPGATGANLIVNQHLHFNVSAVDGPSVQRVLQEQKGTILNMVGEGIRESTTVRKMIQGR